MSDPRPATLLAEQFARFVMDKRWIRESDQTIRQEAFMPHPKFLEVSVTRHDKLSDSAIWLAGERIASSRQKPLFGRADISDPSIKQHSLDIRSDPTSENPNHACIVGWPGDKAAQKIIAQQLAAASIFCRK